MQRLSQRIATLTAALTVVALSLSACGPGYLDKGEKVRATDENRSVYKVLVAYHKAMEDRDIDRLRSMISKRYYENGGTTDSDKDDYGVDKLQSDVIPRLRDNVKRLQFQIRLLDIRIEGEKAIAEYEFFGRALLTEGGRKSYKMWNDFSQMRLIKEGGKWMIAGGL